MIHIAICDDSELDIHNVEECIEHSLIQKNRRCLVKTFTRGKDFLECLEKETFDLIFLDIQMPEITGFDVAQKVYELTGGDGLVFVSSEEQLVFDSLAFRPFAFVRKHLVMEKLPSVIDDWYEKCVDRGVIELNLKDTMCKVNIKDLRYIEVKGHNLFFHTVDEEFRIRGRMADYLYLCEQFSFIRPHLSFLCNPMYVKEIKAVGLTLDNDMVMPVSRGNLDACRKTYMKYIREN